MNLSRNTTIIFHYIFDQYIPPILRDSKWFMWIPFKILFGKKSAIFFNFKFQASQMSKKSFRETYRQASPLFIKRKTDLNSICISEIKANIIGDSVLDVGCGKGFLANLLSKTYCVTATDMIITPGKKASLPSINFVEAEAENLPFKCGQFDTVVCTHLIEHVVNVNSTILELRRVTKKRLIIIVPKQRHYKYTFDLHLHFFPYPFVLTQELGCSENLKDCREVGGDLYYQEDKE